MVKNIADTFAVKTFWSDEYRDKCRYAYVLWNDNTWTKYVIHDDRLGYVIGDEFISYKRYFNINMIIRNKMNPEQANDYINKKFNNLPK